MSSHRRYEDGSKGMEIDSSDDDSRGKQRTPNGSRSNSKAADDNDGYVIVQNKRPSSAQQSQQNQQQQHPSSSNSQRGHPNSSSGPSRNINEALKKALEEAANPGIGDEEPEVLPPPENVNSNNSNNSNEYKRGGSSYETLDQRDPKRRLEHGSDDEKHSAVAASNDHPNNNPSLLSFDTILAEHSGTAALSAGPTIAPLPLQNMKERAKYIPLRLSYEERKNLRLVCAAMNVSDYTNAVDIPFKNKAKRHHTQLQYIVAFLTALICANDYDHGQEILLNRNYDHYEKEVKEMLEIARRYKITNPEKLRSEYGKLIYLMQDSCSETIKPLLGCEIYLPVKTVYETLQDCNGLAILDDPFILLATDEILPDKTKSRNAIQHEIKRKEKAIEHLVKKYASQLIVNYRGGGGGSSNRGGGSNNNNISREDIIRNCLYSISDNNSFLNSNKKPIMDCIDLLKQYFSPHDDNHNHNHHDDNGSGHGGRSSSFSSSTSSSHQHQYSLGIKEGVSGSRLSHSHAMQYHYVLQSLTLWSVIVEDMFRLWYLAEQDLLNETIPYELKNTGQGLQRVQQSPRVYKAMHEILVHVQQSLGKESGGQQGWVGTSVVHLGDHNVPNALVFIDKYAQVARILGPLITTLNNLEALSEGNEGLHRYIKASFGGIEKVKKDILFDFFTHAFDGSGGDNFFDAGSCIDGRLTSAWNWCSQLSDKPYYPLFKLTGFNSFDGQFDK